MKPALSARQMSERWSVFGDACRAVGRLPLIEDRIAVLKALGALATWQPMIEAQKTEAAPTVDKGGG